MIKLQDFITDSLVQIIEGVKNAQAQVTSKGGMINPKNLTIVGGVIRWDSEISENTSFGQTIEFDIEVVASGEKSINGGIGIVSVLGYEAKKQESSSSVSRIKFSVPVLLPQQEVPLKPLTSTTMKSQPTDTLRHERLQH